MPRHPRVLLVVGGRAFDAADLRKLLDYLGLLEPPRDPDGPEAAVRVRRSSGRPLKPCGTQAAYLRHLRAGEKACAECRAANADYYRRARVAAGVRPRELSPCGTPAAYQRHRKNGEPTCDPCRAAWAAQTARIRRERRKLSRGA